MEPWGVVKGGSAAFGNGASVVSRSLSYQPHTNPQAPNFNGSAPPPPATGSGSGGAWTGNDLDLDLDARHPAERHALTLLAIAIPLYAILWIYLSTLVLATWLQSHPSDLTRNGPTHTPRWSAAFLATSSFTNCGMTLFDSNLEPFNRSPLVLAVTASLVLAGNTAFPAFFRLMVWALRAVAVAAPGGGVLGRQRAALGFVLRFPRRVYTHLFPARQTWWLVFMLAGTAGVDWFAFEVMSFGNPALEGIPVGSRVLDGLFQAIGKFFVLRISSFPSPVVSNEGGDH